MVTRISATQMRRVILDGFRQLGMPKLSGDDLEERVRIDEGQVVAHCYRAANLFAMWMTEIGLVQFYDEQGHMLRTLSVLAPATKERRAA